MMKNNNKMKITNCIIHITATIAENYELDITYRCHYSGKENWKQLKKKKREKRNEHKGAKK